MTALPTSIAIPVSPASGVSVSFARLCALFVCVLGEIVLAMWLGIIPVGALPSLAGMTPMAAIGVIIAGLGLLCFTFRRIKLLGRLVGLFLVLAGLLLLTEDMIGLNFGLDRALVPPGDPGSAPVETATGVVGALVLFALALLYADQSRALSIFSQVLAVAMIAQVLIVVAGQIYGVDASDHAFPFTLMSAYGVVSVALLAVGLIAASPDRGIAAAIAEQSPAGEMLRRLLPGILILPLALGWLVRQAEVSTLYDSAATLAIFAVGSVVVLAAFTWAALGAVRRADCERQVALMDLRGQREWLSTTLGSIGDGVIATDPNGSVLLLNKIAEQLTGWPAGDARGRPIWEVFRVVDENSRKSIDDPALKALRERAFTRLESGAILLTRDEKELPVEHSGAPIVGQDGTLAGAVLVFRDVTERRRTAQRQTMLVGELNHRVKNALAIVQSLVQASLRQATNEAAQSMARTLAERLQALHRAHDLLLESQWSGASLKGMVDRELEPYRRERGPKIAIKGSDVLLPPQSTSILAMTLHELATNAVKYGALSQNDGQLNVSWKKGRGETLMLTWEERGAPYVPKKPGRTGFGSQLIDKGIRHNLGGETKMEFRPTGLYVELKVPLTPLKDPHAPSEVAAAPAA